MPTSQNNICVSLFGMASSSAFCVSIGPNRAAMPPMALRTKARIIPPRYFLM